MPCSGRSLLRFLVLDQELVRAFAPGLCTEKRGLFVLVNSSLSLIGAGVALVAQRPVLSRQVVRRMAGRAGRLRGLSGRLRGWRCCSRAGQSQCPARSPAAIRPPRTWPRARAVVLVRDHLNRLFRLREQPSPHTVVAKIAFQHDSCDRVARESPLRSPPRKEERNEKLKKKKKQNLPPQSG